MAGVISPSSWGCYGQEENADPRGKCRPKPNFTQQFLGKIKAEQQTLVKEMVYINILQP